MKGCILKRLLIALGCFSLTTYPILDNWIVSVIPNFFLYFGPFYIIGLVIIVKCKQLFSTGCRVILATTYLSLLIYQGNFLYPFFPNNTVQAATPLYPDYSLLYMNIWKPNTSYDEVRQLISENNPDFLAVVELSAKWDSELSVQSTHPFRIMHLRQDCFGIGLYSKYPIVEIEDTELKRLPIPVIRAQATLPSGKQLEIIALHLLPPLGDESLRVNDEIYNAISSELEEVKTPLILLGDFNATPNSVRFNRFVERNGLSHSMWGRGLFSTWTGRSKFLRLTIDHILMRSNVEISEIGVQRDIGSDHLPIGARFSVF